MTDIINPLIRLIIVIDPFTTLMLFLSLTPGVDKKERLAIIRKAAVASALLLMFFGLGGVRCWSTWA